MNQPDSVPTAPLTAHRTLAAGNIILQRYTLIRLLGHGGMSLVWLARDNHLERDVALKLLPEIVAFHPEALAELKRETVRSLGLTHPNIVRVHDFVSDGSLAAICMEYVPGKTLARLKAEHPNRVFSPEELAPLVAPIVAALSYAHETVRVAHRDLKPDNIMVTPEGRVKLLDFGIAASINETVVRLSNRANTGTLAYMSPQQIRGRRPVPSDDIYAFGATLYELVTSKPPFFRGALEYQILSETPAPIAERRRDLGVSESLPAVGAVWEQAVLQCLAKEPADRPATISAAAAALSRRDTSPPPVPTTPTLVDSPPAPPAPLMPPSLAITGQVSARPLPPSPTATTTASGTPPPLTKPAPRATSPVASTIAINSPTMPRYRLFSGFQVALAAFFGTPAIACAFWSQNFRALGKPHAANLCIIGGIVGTVALFGLASVLPEGFPAMAIPIGYTVGLQGAVQSVHGTALKLHAARQGRLGSWGILIGVCSAALVLQIAIVIQIINAAFAE